MSLIYATRAFPLSLIIGFFLLLGLTGAEAQVSSSNKNLKFSFAFVAQVNTDGRAQIIPVVDNMVLRSGSLIKLYLESQKEVNFYLFHQDLQGGLVLLFPKDLLSATIPKDTPVYIPEGNSWMELDSHTGKETFHLLFSTVRLERLEKLYNHYLMLKEKEGITHSADSILNQIKSLKRENLGKQAEKPIRIAGKLRGNPSSGSLIPMESINLATEITTTGTYIKSVTIDHK